MESSKNKLVMLLTASILICACGDNAVTSMGHGDDALAIKVRRAGNFNPNIEHGRIELYRISIEGEGMGAPIVAEFPGDAAEGIVEGVPAGRDRTVTVSAVNPNGQAVYAGEAEGVRVGGGVVSVEVELESVPIFTNLASGNSVDNTRLVLRVFADPDGQVVVEDFFEGGADVLIDAASNLPEIDLDISTGMGALAPAVLRAGGHRFVARDVLTGRYSEVSVRVTDGGGRSPAPFVAAGRCGADAISAAGLQAVVFGKR